VPCLAWPSCTHAGVRSFPNCTRAVPSARTYTAILQTHRWCATHAHTAILRMQEHERLRCTACICYRCTCICMAILHMLVHQGTPLWIVMQAYALSPRGRILLSLRGIPVRRFNAIHSALGGWDRCEMISSSGVNTKEKHRTTWIVKCRIHHDASRERQQGSAHSHPVMHSRRETSTHSPCLHLCQWSPKPFWTYVDSSAKQFSRPLSCPHRSLSLHAASISTSTNQP